MVEQLLAFACTLRLKSWKTKKKTRKYYINKHTTRHKNDFLPLGTACTLFFSTPLLSGSYGAFDVIWHIYTYIHLTDFHMCVHCVLRPVVATASNQLYYNTLHSEVIVLHITSRCLRQFFRILRALAQAHPRRSRCQSQVTRLSTIFMKIKYAQVILYTRQASS